MMNPIASSTHVTQAYQAPPTSAKPAAGGHTPSAPDTVELSSAAKAAMGDVDHDGDSH